VPGTEAEAFEGAMREAVPELMASEPGLLFKMTTMVTPETVLNAGVGVCHLIQRPGTPQRGPNPRPPAPARPACWAGD
jgi:hypothetical protein